MFAKESGGEKKKKFTNLIKHECFKISEDSTTRVSRKGNFYRDLEY